MRHVITVQSVRGRHPKDVRGVAGEPGFATDGPTISTKAVYVMHTTVDETLAAIRVAADFAAVLSVPVTVVHFRTVPFTLPVETPPGISPIETEAFAERLAAEGLDVRLRVYLCREERQAAPSAFERHSLIMVGGRRRWWPTRASRLGRMLEAAGHFVVFVDVGEHRAFPSRDARTDSAAVPTAKEASRA